MLNFKEITNFVLVGVLSIFSFSFINYDYTSMLHEICDDAYISLQYAYNLWNFGELNYYPGYKVEGYTNFLWVLSMSLSYPFNIDPIVFTKVLGFFSGIGLIIFIHLLTRELFTSKIVLILITIAFGLNLQIAYMSVWGLETTFYMMLYTASMYYYLKDKLVISSLFFCFAAMTRLEVLLLGIILIVLEIAVYRDKKRAVKILLPFLLLLLPYFIARWSYYGYLLPNTFYVKTGSGTAIIKRGVDYLIYNLNKINLLYLLFFTLIASIIRFFTFYEKKT